MDIHFQKALLNEKLQDVYAIIQRNKNSSSQDENMRDQYDKKKDFFYLEIQLIEMLPDPPLVNNNNNNNKLMTDQTPQKVFLIDYLDGKYKNITQIWQQNDIYNLCHMVTPNLNKSLWLNENCLKQNLIIKTFCKMNLSDMENMLKFCADPKICLSQATFTINKPEKFIDVINRELSCDVKKTLDFIPYVRPHTLNSLIKENGIYYLDTAVNIELVNESCYKYM